MTVSRNFHKPFCHIHRNLPHKDLASLDPILRGVALELFAACLS